LGIDPKSTNAFPPEVTEDLNALILEKKLVEDEKRFRTAIVAILPYMDPAGFPANGDWKSKDIVTLRTAFLKMLGKSEKGKPISDALWSAIGKLVKKDPPRNPHRQPPPLGGK
jgi:hypothetical protein